MKNILIIFFLLFLLSSCIFSNKKDITKEQEKKEQNTFQNEKNNIKIIENKKERLIGLENILCNKKKYDINTLKKYDKKYSNKFLSKYLYLIDMENLEKKGFFINDYNNLKNIALGSCSSISNKEAYNVCIDFKNNSELKKEMDNFTCDSEFIEEKKYILGMFYKKLNCNFPKDFSTKGLIYYYYYKKDKNSYSKKLDNLLIQKICNKGIKQKD